MTNVNDVQLEMMSVKQLRELRTTIEAAIRAKIASTRVQRLPKVEAVKTIDLERDANAWKARRMVNGS
jgi:hypothetical protein